MAASEDKPKRPRILALRAYFFTFLARGIRASGRLLAFLCAARFFSVSETGNFAFAFTIGTIAGIITDLGLSEYLNREIPAARFANSSLERHSLHIRLAGIFLGTAVAWLVVLALDPDTPASTAGTLLFCCAAAAADFLGAVRRAHGRNELEALESSLPTAGALVTVASLGLWSVSFDTFQIALGLSAATLVVLRFTSRLREMDGGDASGAPISLPQTVWASRWFLMRAVGVWMLFDTPMVLLKLLTTPETVAFYAAALRPVGFITMPFVVLGSVFTPSLSHDRAVSHEQLTANVKRLNFLALLMAPAGYLVCTLGGKVLLLAFGSKYLNSESILGVLALAFIVYFASPSAVPLVVAGRERALVFVSMVSAALLAGLCVWLIPSHGALGAAYACLATFSAAKLAHMVMYWPVRLSVGDWRHLGTAGYMVLWLLLMTRLSGTAQVTVLVAGGVAAGLVLLRQMLRTHMFS